MFPLILTVLKKGLYQGGDTIIIPFKDCSDKGEHPNITLRP